MQAALPSGGAGFGGMNSAAVASVAAAASAPASVQAVSARAGKGVRWAVAQSAGKHGIDLLVFLGLARILAPQDFGLVALASAAVVLICALAEMGLGETLVQRQDLSPEHAHAAFWMAMLLALLCTGGLYAAAPWAARAYGQAALAPILQALSPLFVVQALTLVPQALMQRELSFKTLALRGLLGSVVGGATGLGLALSNAGPWSLVGQQLAAGFVGLVGLWLFTTWRPALRFCRRSAWDLIQFSRYVLGARLLNVLTSKADDLLVGLLLGPVALGYYSVACRMLLALDQLFCQGVGTVALSAFSRYGHTPDVIRPLYLGATRVAALWAFPIYGGVALLAPDLIAVTLGARWLPAVPLLQFLMLAGLLQALSQFNHSVFKASGQPQLSMRVAFGSTALNVVTLAVAVQISVVAVAASYALRTVLIAPIGMLMACRIVQLPLRAYGAVLLRPVLGLTMAVAAVLLLQWFLPQWAQTSGLPLMSPAVRLALLAPAGALVYAATVALWWLSTRSKR